jgi:RNA methyltransferase, TrmH family
VTERVDVAALLSAWPNDSIFALEVEAQKSLLDIDFNDPSLWIFGNEARGLPQWNDQPRVSSISIPMPGNAESLNLAAAASIVMFYVTQLQHHAQ